MARMMALCSLPRSNPGNECATAEVYKRFFLKAEN